MRIFLTFSLYFFLFISNYLFGQSDPQPFDLSSGNYSFTEWAASSPAGTYPANMVIHRATVNEPAIASFIAGSDYTQAYNLTAGSRVVGAGGDGITFLNTGSAGNLGALVLALNTIGRGNISVDYRAFVAAVATGTLPRDYRIRMQYRVGSGLWTNIAGLNDFSSIGQAAGEGLEYNNVILPAACNNAPLVQLRWVYFQEAPNGGGNRPRLGVDNILISSEEFVCNAPTEAAVNISFSNITPLSVTVNWTNGNGARRIVIARENEPVETLPEQGVELTSSAEFGTLASALGEGFVVYDGIDNFADITGLTAGTSYFFTVVEYDCDPAIYLLTDAPSSSVIPAATPEIIVSPNTLITLSTQVNVPSTVQSVAVSGTFLEGPIFVLAPEFFELSLNLAGPFSPQIQIEPIDGSIDSVQVYIRFNPNVEGSQTGNLSFSSENSNIVQIALVGFTTISASLPEPYFLCNGDYEFLEWSDASPAATYPLSMTFHRFNTTDPGINALDIANYVDAYNSSSGSRINGIGADGITFINTGTAGNLGAAVLALNTEGRTQINVDFVAGLITQSNGNPNPRDYRIRFQYRIGNGFWTDLTEPVEYASSGQVNGDFEEFTDITLPSEVEDQELVYLRWFYHQFALNDGGSRPRMRLDNIRVKSTSSIPPQSDFVAEFESEALVIPANTTGSIQTAEDGIQVWSFTVRDGGENTLSDGLPTELTGLSILPGAANTVDWTNILAEVALFNGELKLADGTISDEAIAFSFDALTIEDTESRTLALRVSLVDDGSIEDGGRLGFRLESDLIQTNGGCSGTEIISAIALESSTMRNEIDVIANQLLFVNPPVEFFESASFNAEVTNVDEFNNIDRSTRSISLSWISPSNGILSGGTALTNQELSNGSFTWNAMTYNAIETFQLIVSDDDGNLAPDTIFINCLEPIGIEDITLEPLSAFPNPVSMEQGQITLSHIVNAEVLNSIGQQVARLENANRLSVIDFNKGIYIIKTDKGQHLRFIIN